MLYKMLKDIISNESYKVNGDTPESMQKKLDVFLTKNRITLDQYNELSTILNSQKDSSTSIN